MDFAQPWVSDFSVNVKSPNAEESARPEFNGMSEIDFDRKDVCYMDPELGLFVHCVYGFYQDSNQVNLKDPTIPEPDMALLVNPGLGQPQRRSWDPVLSYLLSKNITTIISTQTGGGSQGLAGGLYNPLMHNEVEPVQCSSVMNAYGANLVQSVVSPFPMNLSPDDKKNSVLAVYKGYQAGRGPCTPRPLPKAEMDWLLTQNRSDAMKKPEKDPRRDTRTFAVVDQTGQFDPDFVTVMSRPVCAEYDQALAENVLAVLQMSGLVHTDRNAQNLAGRLAMRADGSEERIHVWDWLWLCELAHDSTLRLVNEMC